MPLMRSHAPGEEHDALRLNAKLGPRRTAVDRSEDLAVEPAGTT